MSGSPERKRLATDPAPSSPQPPLEVQLEIVRAWNIEYQMERDSALRTLAEERVAREREREEWQRERKQILNQNWKEQYEAAVEALEEVGYAVQRFMEEKLV